MRIQTLLVLTLCFSVGRSEQKPLHEGWRLIDLGHSEPIWMSPEVVSTLPLQIEGGFRDITNVQDMEARRETVWDKRITKVFPDQLHHQEDVRNISAISNAGALREILTTLTAFNNRYYTAPSGVLSAQYIFDRVSSLIQESGRNDVQVDMFENQFPQPSVIARFSGTSNSEEIVILGSHQDSISIQVPQPDRPNARAPGADDDGSGSVVCFEVFRSLLQSGFTPERPVEIQWYAAEEVGLLGSANIANDYAATGKQVYSMVQLDMSGWAPLGFAGAQYQIITDYADVDLARFMTLCVDEYSVIGWRYSRYGRPASDHASFNRAGYAATWLREGTNPDQGQYTWIHTAQDTIDKLDFNFMYEFVKVTTGYVVELSYLM